MVKPRPLRSITLLLIAVTVLLAQFSAAGTASPRVGTADTGILLLAHGGKYQRWNDEVAKVAAEVDQSMPVEVAFGMANKRSMQQAIERLITRGVREIVAVPLFISSHSSVITSTQYLLGARNDAPPELAVYAALDHSHGAAHAVSEPQDASFDPATPIESPVVPILMTTALDRHPLVAEILLSNALSISHDPAHEVVLVVAHGPVEHEDNLKWLSDMEVLVKHLRAAQLFKRVEFLTARDDAPEPVRAQATAALRAAIERAAGEGNNVLMVPLLLSYGGVEERIKQRLDGLEFTMAPRGLLPDARLAQWVLLTAQTAQ